MWVLAYFTQDGQPVTGLSPTTLIKDVDTGLDVITGAAMGDIGDGFYRYDFSTHDPNKNYAVTCDSITLSGVERYTYASSGEYGEVLDTIESTVVVVDVRTTLLRKIQTNRLELFDGATDNWVLYDDDAVTPLLTFSVSDKNGDIIVQCPGSPSKRSGVAGISGTQPPHEGELHYRLHSVTNPLDHYANANKLFYSDNSGDVQELAHGPASTILASTGSGSAPAWTSLTGAGNVLVTYNGGGNDITISGTVGSWQFGVNDDPWDVINSGDTLFFKEAGTTTITRNAENEITISGGSGEWQFGVNTFPEDVVGVNDVLFFNEAGTITITRSAENEITISGGSGEWQFGVNTFPEDVISSGEILFFNGSDGVIVTRTAENEITFSGSSDFYTKSEITTISGDIVSQIITDHNDLLNIQGGLPNNYYHITDAQRTYLTNVSGVLNASTEHIHDDRYFTESEITTISGDIVAQRYTDEEAQDAVGNIMFGAGTVTVTYNDIANTITVSGGTSGAGIDHGTLDGLDDDDHSVIYHNKSEITTISGDIVAQIPTDFYTQGEVTTISGDIVSQIITEHNNLYGLQGGEGLSNAFYHLSYIEYLALTSNSGVVDASSQHIHDDRYYTQLQITTISGDIVAQIPTDYYTQSEVTTISGDIVAQIPTDYYTQGEVTTISGDIVAQIPTDYYTQSEVTTISGDIVAQIITDHNDLLNIQGGTVDEYYHLTNTQHLVLTSSGGIGDASTEHIHDDRYFTESEIITISGDIIAQNHLRLHDMTSTLDHQAGEWAVFYSNGSNNVAEIELALTASGTVLQSNGPGAAPSFESDFYSQSEVNQLIGQNKSGREPIGSKDTGTSVSFAAAFPTDEYSVFVSLENTVDSPSSEYVITIDDKTASGFSVHYSGKIDSNNYYLNWHATLSGGSAGGNYITEVMDDTSPELGGDLVLGNYSVVLNTTPIGWSGDISTMIVDWNDNGIGTPLHMKSNGHWEQCTAASGTTRIPCAAMALEAGTGSKKILWKGIAKKVGWPWTAGDIIYISTVDGALTNAQPTNTGQIIQAVGVAIASDTIGFDPDLVWAEVEQ